jgi:hypothetical protein
MTASLGRLNIDMLNGKGYIRTSIGQGCFFDGT